MKVELKAFDRGAITAFECAIQAIEGQDFETLTREQIIVLLSEMRNKAEQIGTRRAM